MGPRVSVSTGHTFQGSVRKFTVFASALLERGLDAWPSGSEWGRESQFLQDTHSKARFGSLWSLLPLCLSVVRCLAEPERMGPRVSVSTGHTFQGSVRQIMVCASALLGRREMPGRAGANGAESLSFYRTHIPKLGSEVYGLCFRSA